MFNRHMVLRVEFKMSLRRFTDKMWELQRRHEARKLRRSDDIHDRISGYNLIPIEDLEHVEEKYIRENAYMNEERLVLVEKNESNYYEKELLEPRALEYAVAGSCFCFLDSKSMPTKLIMVRQGDHESYYAHTLLERLLSVLGVEEEEAVMRSPNQDDYPLCIRGKNGWVGYISPRIEEDDEF